MQRSRRVIPSKYRRSVLAFFGTYDQKDTKDTVSNFYRLFLVPGAATTAPALERHLEMAQNLNK
jgi:hypothetical protein